MQYELYLGDYVCTHESENPHLSSNGGDYSFGYYPVLLEKDGGQPEQVGVLYSTSAEFPYCQIGGSFTDTYTLSVKTSPGASDNSYIAVSVSEYLGRSLWDWMEEEDLDFLPIEDFLWLLDQQ